MNSHSNQISAVIITFNEEKNIERCILSLQKVADEIVVIDSFSTDKTKEICLKLGVRFYQREWQGYGTTKNYGNALCSNDYILSVDADEELSEELKRSILSEKANGLSGAYEFNRLNNYVGTWIKHAGWYPDKKIRLFSKKEVLWNEKAVHEMPEVSSQTKINWLPGDLLHYSFKTYQEHAVKINKYANLAGNYLKEKSKLVLFLKMLLNPLFRFVKMYFFQLGIMYGIKGLILCFYTSKEVYLKYFVALKIKTSNS